MAKAGALLKNAPQRQQVLALYKEILARASTFFDDRARLFLRQSTRAEFRRNKRCQDVDKVQSRIRQAQRASDGCARDTAVAKDWSLTLYFQLVNKLKRADQQDRNAIQYILRYTYGVSGPVRHVLLKPILEPSKEGVQPEPLIAHRPRTAPPPKLSQLAEALIVQFSGKKLEPKLPIPEFKPLHPTRQANLLWRHRSKILRTIRPPLPSRILDELERKAGKGMIDEPSAQSGDRGETQLSLPSCNAKQMQRIRHLASDQQLSPPSAFWRDVLTKQAETLDTKRLVSMMTIPRLLHPDAARKYIHRRSSNRFIQRQYQFLLRNIPLLERHNNRIQIKTSDWALGSGNAAAKHKWYPLKTNATDVESL